MKTFVVTGCNGFIGSHMCYELRQSYPDCHIRGVDKVDKPHLRHLYDAYSPIDLSINPLYTAANPGEVDCVFHFAAYNSVEEGERDPWSYYRNNIGATFGAIDFAQRYGVKNFIFSSTAAVYGDSINPYHVIFHKWYWHGAENVNFEIIKQYVDNFNAKQST